MVREYIYTTPGAGPVSFDTAKPVSQQDVGAATVAAMSGIPTLAVQPLDWALSTIRALGTLPEILRQSGGGQTAFDLATQGQGFNNEPGTRTLAKAVERNVPERLFAPAVENALLFGQRENIVNRVGEAPFMLGETAGMLGGTLALASKFPKVFQAFDTATDVITATPSQAIFNMAKTPMGALGASAGVGAASSVMPALDVYYDAETGQTNPGAAALTMGLGAGIGAAIPGVLMAPQIAKQGKQVLDDIVKGATGMIKQSDDMQIVKQINQRALERQQMEAFTQVATERMDSLPPPRLPEPVQPKVDEVLTQPEQEQPISLIDEMEADIGPVQKELDDLIVKQQEIKRNIPTIQKELESLPETIGKKFSVDSDNSLEGTIADILSSNKIDNQSYKQIADLDSASARQFTSKEKGRALDDLSQEIESKLGADVTGDATEQLNIQEKIVEFTKKYKSAKDYYRQRAQAELDIKRQEIGESFTKAQQELKQLEQEIPGRQEYIANQKEQYKARGVEMPEPEPLASLVASKEGIKQLNLDGTEVPIIQTKEVPTTLTSNLRIRGDVGYSPRPLVNRLSGISQKLGSKVEAANLIGTRMRRLEMAERLKPTLDVLRKYKNNFEIQAKLADRKLDEVPEELATAVRSSQEILNKMADDLEQIGVKIPTRLKNYLPIRYKDYDGLQETIRVLKENPQLRGTKYADMQKSFEELKDNTHLLDLDYRTLEQKATPLRRDPKAMQHINKKLEELRTITKHTPEIMKSAYSADESLLRYIDEYADQMGRADLFGGRVDIGVEQGILKLLQEYGSDLTPKKQQEALELIARHFLGEEYVSSPVFKTIQSAIASTLLTGFKTGAAQLLSMFSNLERTGMLNTAEGIAHALKQVLPIGEANKYVNKVSKQILSEVSEKSSVEVLGNYIDFLKDTRYTPLEKSGRMAQDISFSIVKAGDWFEKESTYAANHSWFKRQFKKKKSDELDLFFERYEEGLKQHGITKEQAKEGFLKGEDNISTIAVMALRSEERLVSSGLDKAAFAIPTDRANEIGSLVANLMTYSLKHAADLSDRTLRMAVQGVKEKDPRKVKLAMKNLLAFAAVLPLYTTFDKSRKEGKPTDITIADMASSALSSTAPMLQRGLRYLNENLQGTGDTKDLLNFTVPGSAVPLQLGVDIASDPLGTFDPARNKSFKRMPPGFIFDTLYSFSDQAKIDKQKQLERNSPTRKAIQEYKLAKDARKAGLPPSALSDPRAARQKITERQQVMSRIKKYGTNDEVQASRNKMIQQALPVERKRFQAAMEAKRSQLGEQRYQELLRQQDEIIIRKLNELMENGKTI